MAGFIKNIIKILTIAAVIPALAFGVQQQNPRTIKNTSNRTSDGDANAAIRRSATSVIARSVGVVNRKARTVVVARPGVARSAANISARHGTNIVANLSGVSRSATPSKSGIARSGTNKLIKSGGKAGMSRAANARATAIFNDVTKIGGEYANCRDAYATCMDQFCGNANDTYRRCFCSDKFMTFRDTSDNLDKALGMLADFQNNNLNAVDKTTAEVNAMYSSTAGEDAIKKDTSASQRLLDEIGDILSGKKTTNNMSTASLGILNFGELSDLGDIWSSSGSSIFDSRSMDNISALEGHALYQRASKECAAVVRDTCSGDTTFNLASSSYSVLVTQDCNTFEKSLNAKKESVMQTVRQAEKLLRDARLEEYRAHNSQDVNECLSRVEEAITNPMACGENYKKCLDYTGEYINMETGEPIYSGRLFKMMDNIAPTLGDVDVVGTNARWNTFLEEKKKFVTTALDTCRSLADDVWNEFKRTAVIRIAQAQESKIQEVKDTCVQTIRDCYNMNDETLNDLTDSITDKKLDTMAGRSLAVRGMCAEKVVACAALYGDVDGCKYDKTTRKIESKDKDKRCGLKSLLAYVDSIDTARVAQGCEKAVSAYAHELCDPDDSDYYSVYLNGGNIYALSYPAGCINKSRPELRASLLAHAKNFCSIDKAEDEHLNTDVIERVIKDIFDQLGLAWTYGCEKVGGTWYGPEAVLSWAAGSLKVGDLKEQFYKEYYGGMSLTSILASIKAGDIGACINANCELSGATTKTDGSCDFKDPDWYKERCGYLGYGSFDKDKGVCEPALIQEEVTDTKGSGNSKGKNWLIKQDAVNNLFFGEGKCAGVACPGGWVPVETKNGCACKSNSSGASTIKEIQDELLKTNRVFGFGA